MRTLLAHFFFLCNDQSDDKITEDLHKLIKTFKSFAPLTVGGLSSAMQIVFTKELQTDDSIIDTSLIKKRTRELTQEFFTLRINDFDKQLNDHNS